ncbi:undecaprenyl pyrophosphate synthetase [Methylovirgula ligni]|uniref:Isoprenyl transferase n=2 Tax=Methylovirgula ligni TaxID=569860 RepID=A0A3D9YQV6_9HYPH|nr:undecaprenyl pyrophosphate synthetase [Methylovirgula ligni]
MTGAEAAMQVKPVKAASSQPATPAPAKTRDVPPLQGRVPRHVGVIMDGNGRWASSRGLPRIEGHRRGVEALRATVRAAIDLGLDYLTVYSFSSENWSRPVEEISDLMGLLKFFIRNDLAELARAGVRIKMIGTRSNLKPDILALLEEAESATAANSGLNLVVAFNYGSRQEIAAAMRLIAQKVAEGTLDPASIDADVIASHLDTAGIPDPDLIIRTSGEQRLSNFLMWQAAYSEFVFLPIHWPDFDRAALAAAIEEFSARERRFGGVTLPPASAKSGR